MTSPLPATATVRLKPGHVQPVWIGHPWIYAQAVDRVEGGATAGDEVSVVDPRGNLLGRGFYSPGSAIPVRLLVRDAKTRLDAAFFRMRLERALALRSSLGLPNERTTGFRLVHAEGDGLPGLVVDRYGDVLAVQFGTMGMKHREALIHEALWSLVGPRAILDRTSVQTAKIEGFRPASGTVRGEDVRSLEVLERGLHFRIPVEVGQKTGFYFDQRGLRARIEELAAGARVLDAYSYVGAFAVAAARGGAREVVAVDESALAIEVGAECAAANGVGDRIQFVKGDARHALTEAKGSFDIVIVDPPRLAPDARGAGPSARRVRQAGRERRAALPSPEVSSFSVRARRRSTSRRSPEPSRWAPCAAARKRRCSSAGRRAPIIRSRPCSAKGST